MQELRPQAGGYGFERAFPAAHPHQQAQACLEALACTLGVPKECLHLQAEFL